MAYINGKKILFSPKISITGSGEGVDAIIPVATLPTENISTKHFYKTPDGLFWYDGSKWRRVLNEDDVLAEVHTRTLYVNDEAVFGDNDQVTIDSSGISVGRDVDDEFVSVKIGKSKNGIEINGKKVLVEGDDASLKSVSANEIFVGDEDNVYISTDGITINGKKVLVDGEGGSDGHSVKDIDLLDLSPVKATRIELQPTYGIRYHIEQAEIEFEDGTTHSIALDNRIPIVAGKNVEFEVDNENKLVKIKAKDKFITLVDEAMGVVSDLSADEHGVTWLAEDSEIEVNEGEHYFNPQWLKKIPLVAGDNIEFEPITTDAGAKVIKINAEGGVSIGDEIEVKTIATDDLTVRKEILVGENDEVAINKDRIAIGDGENSVMVRPNGITANGKKVLVEGSGATVDKINYIDSSFGDTSKLNLQQDGIYWGKQAEIEAEDDEDVYNREFEFFGFAPIVAGDGVEFEPSTDSVGNPVVRINAEGGGSGNSELIQAKNLSYINFEFDIVDVATDENGIAFRSEGVELEYDDNKTNPEYQYVPTNHRIPIVAGEGISFDVDQDNTKVTINATGGGKYDYSIDIQSDINISGSMHLNSGLGYNYYCRRNTDKTYTKEQMLGATVDYSDGSNGRYDVKLSESHIVKADENGVAFRIGEACILVVYNHTEFNPFDTEERLPENGTYLGYNATLTGVNMCQINSVKKDGFEDNTIIKELQAKASANTAAPCTLYYMYFAIDGENVDGEYTFIEKTFFFPLPCTERFEDVVSANNYFRPMDIYLEDIIVSNIPYTLPLYIGEEAYHMTHLQVFDDWIAVGRIDANGDSDVIKFSPENVYFEAYPVGL